MSIQVKNEIRRFYNSKINIGKTLSTIESEELFGKRRYVYCTFNNDATNTINDIVLITKKELTRRPKLMQWVFINGRKELIGTNLIPLRSSMFSWWELNRFGSGLDILDDIEECHINLRIKNRDSVISYLTLIKKYIKNAQTQLKLPGF